VAAMLVAIWLDVARGRPACDMAASLGSAAFAPSLTWAFRHSEILRLRVISVSLGP